MGRPRKLPMRRGSKSGSAQSPPPPFPLTSQLKSSRNCRRGDICFAGAGSSSSPSRTRFRRGEVQQSRCCLLCLRYCSPPPSPGCFLESRQPRRFPSANMGTGSPGRAVPIRAIHRYGALGKLEASASPAPVPRLLPPHGLAFVGEKCNHPRCCFHRVRHYPPGPSPGCFLESRQRRRFPSVKMGTGSPGRTVPIRAIYRKNPAPSHRGRGNASSWARSGTIPGRHSWSGDARASGESTTPAQTAFKNKGV